MTATFPTSTWTGESVTRSSIGNKTKAADAGMPTSDPSVTNEWYTSTLIVTVS